MNLLEGKTILITGASKGIGLSIVNTFVKHGASVLILLSRDIDKLKIIKEETENKYTTKVNIYKTDIGNLESIKEVIAQIKQAKISIDVLVNNAGIMIDGVLRMIKPETIYSTFETNVYGTIFITQLITSSMIANRQGSIINISSIIGTKGYAGNSVYSASKSAIIGFTKSMSKEFAGFNIRVNAIAPGLIDTGMTKNINENMISTIGLKRIGKPEDVANLALFLASDLSAYITNQVIGVDGGMII